MKTKRTRQPPNFTITKGTNECCLVPQKLKEIFFFFYNFNFKFETFVFSYYLRPIKTKTEPKKITLPSTVESFKLISFDTKPAKKHKTQNNQFLGFYFLSKQMNQQKRKEK